MSINVQQYQETSLFSFFKSLIKCQLLFNWNGFDTLYILLLRISSINIYEKKRYICAWVNEDKWIDAWNTIKNLVFKFNWNRLMNGNIVVELYYIWRLYCHEGWWFSCKYSHFFRNKKDKNNNWMDFCLENTFNLHNFWCMHYAWIRYSWMFANLFYESL